MPGNRGFDGDLWGGKMVSLYNRGYVKRVIGYGKVFVPIAGYGGGVGGDGAGTTQFGLGGGDADQLCVGASC